jgi:predicted PurR-regulated permease PerM
MNGTTSLKQVNAFLLCGILIVAILYYARAVLIPVTFAVFFAMLFTGLSNRMEHHGVSRILSSLISMLILMAVIFSIGFMVYMQSRRLADEMPEIEKKSLAFLSKVQGYISTEMNVSESKQEELMKKQLQSFGESAGRFLTSFISGTFGLLAAFVLVLIFTFLFLYQREKYESFFIRISRHADPEEARKLLHRISQVSQRYLTGRALSVLIFTALFTVGFLIVGLKNAFLLAFVAALLTIVPYIGSIVGGLFPFAVALVTEDSINVAFGALAVIVIIQAIDNYFIEPYIIGGEVNISGFFTILILVIGGTIWGVAGMILFLPMLGVAKIIFDAIPELNAYGYLVGDGEQDEQISRIWNKIKKMFGSHKN